MWHTALIIGVAIIGGALIIASRRMHQPPTSWREVPADLVRDIGVALLVAVVVGLGFEVYERAKAKEQDMETALDARMSESLTPDVWLGVKHQILEKRLLRRDAEIRLRLQRNPALPPGQIALAVEFAYNLYNLSDQRIQTTVEHELDYQLAAPAQHLPRFESVFFDGPGGSNFYQGDHLERIVKQGAVRIPVDLGPRSSSQAKIEVKRVEIVHAPGSYNLYMTEYTKGVKIHVDDCPGDIDVEVRVRPEGNAEQARKAGSVWYLDALVLPGQGIEMKFRNRTVH